MHLQLIVVINHVLILVMVVYHLRVLEGVYFLDSIHHDMPFLSSPNSNIVPYIDIICMT